MSFFTFCIILLNSVFFTISQKTVHILGYIIKNIARIQSDEFQPIRQDSLRQCGRTMPSNGAFHSSFIPSMVHSFIGGRSTNRGHSAHQQNNFIISTNSVFFSSSILSIHSSIVSFNFMSLSSISTLLIFESGLKRMNIHFPL